MECSRCRHQNEAGAKFCEECAAPLAVACARCGRPLSPTAKFCPECAHPAGRPLSAAPARRFDSPEAYTPRHLVEKILTSKGALEGERKHVTVLFADVKGSMELLGDRDPEATRKLLDPVLERMMDAVHHYEGTVNQAMGDGIMALFGAPLAHEDHAVRACYAALRMQEAVRRYSDELRRSEGVEVQIRVGLNSGDVVVRSIGSDLRMDYTAVGQTTNLAARLLCAGTTSFSAGQIDEASSYAREALVLTRRLGARASEAHALCLLGDVASTGGTENADGYYREALTLADSLGMRPIVAHCHLGLGKLHRRRSDGPKAHEQLTTAATMYREMGMRFWLEQAEVEMRELP